MAGTAAASSPGIGSGCRFGPALKAEGGELLSYLTAFTVGAFDFGIRTQHNLFEIILAVLAMKFEDGHSQTPFLFYYNKGIGGKAIQMR